MSAEMYSWAPAARAAGPGGAGRLDLRGAGPAAHRNSFDPRHGLGAPQDSEAELCLYISGRFLPGHRLRERSHGAESESALVLEDGDIPPSQTAGHRPAHPGKHLVRRRVGGIHGHPGANGRNDGVAHGVTRA